MAYKVIILNLLYMPFKFLGIFTEYPQLTAQEIYSGRFYLRFLTISKIFL